MYLGEQDDDSPEAFELIDRINQAVQATPAGDARRALQWIRDNHLPLPTEPWAWESLKAFFRRPWFQRKWIIQEATVASNATFFCGDWQADWSRIETVDQAVHKYGLAVNDHTTYDDLKTSTELQQGLAQIHALVITKNCWRRNMRFQLMELLYRFQTARASKRHDHLYALLNLATEASDLAGGVTYDLSVAEVVENYAMFFLQLKGNIEVLYRAGLQGHQLLAPSWVSLTTARCCRKKLFAKPTRSQTGTAHTRASDLNTPRAPGTIFVGRCCLIFITLLPEPTCKFSNQAKESLGSKDAALTALSNSPTYTSKVCLEP